MQNSGIKIIILILVFDIWFLICFSERCHADLYKYIDENGTIFFTDAPTHNKYVKIKGTSSSSVGQNKGKEVMIKKAKGKETDTVYKNRNTNLSKDILYKNIRYTAGKHNIDPDLVWAIIKTESNFNSRAISSKGAKGLMQLMPAVARTYDVSDPFNPHQNVEGGIRHMRYLLMVFDGDLRLSLAAYNAGENTVINYKDVPPFSETEGYVSKVLSFYRYLKSNKSVISQ